MEIFRVITAFIGFLAGTFLVIGILATGFNWLDLLAGFLFYLFAYAVWPSKRHGKRDSVNSVVDALEFIVEFPVEAIIWFFRLLGRLFKGSPSGKSDGIDIDFL